MTRITLHDYRTDPSLSQKDGVNLAHENIATVLKSSQDPHLSVTFHDFNRVLADESHAWEVLSTTDCVVSNVGPHAHYYFHLREKFGLDFRIFRDVRTAIWSSYLLQEHLCQPYLRPQDVLLVASHYTRGLYEKMFPHLQSMRTVRCYPLTVGFPPDLAAVTPADRTPGSVFTLGYIGRLSEDKNFPDIVQLLITLNRQSPGRYRLLACGDVHSPSCDPSNILQDIAQQLGPGDFFEYLPPRNNGLIWALYRQFDAMVFPSTSNLETLGRVLIEASYAGVPVVCGAHAAAPELMPPSSLCRVDYATAQAFSAHFDHSLGRVNIEDMARAVTHPDLAASNCHLDYQEHPQKFMALLSDRTPGAGRVREALRLDPAQRSLIQALDVALPEALSLAEANALIASLTPWFVDLQARGSAGRQTRLTELRTLSRHPERTEKFIQKTTRTRCDFTDVGGIDIELCHIAGFYPDFRLKAAHHVTALANMQATTAK